MRDELPVIRLGHLKRCWREHTVNFDMVWAHMGVDGEIDMGGVQPPYFTDNLALTWGLGPFRWEKIRNMTKTLLYPLRNIDTQKPHFCTQGMPLSSIFTEFSTKNHFFVEKNLTPPVPNPMLMYNFTIIITFSPDQNVYSWNLITDRNRKPLGWLEQKSVDL